MRKGTPVDFKGVAVEEQKLFEASKARENQARKKARVAFFYVGLFSLLASALMAMTGVILKSELSSAFGELGGLAQACVIGPGVSLLFLATCGFVHRMFSMSEAASAADFERGMRCPLRTTEQLSESPDVTFRRNCNIQIERLRGIEHVRIFPALLSLLGAVAMSAILFKLKLSSVESWLYFAAALFGALVCFAALVEQACRAWALAEKWREVRAELEKTHSMQFAPGTQLT